MHPGWILNLHGVGKVPSHVPAEERPYWITPDQLRRILDLVSSGSQIWLTFDDGNISDLEIAVPELIARGLRAGFFVCAGRIGTPGYLGQQDLREITAAGMSVGSHGWSHRPWRRLSTAERRDEFERARRKLEEVLSRPVHAAACPFGAYDRQSIAGLRSAGFRVVYTSDGGPAITGTFLQARWTLRADTPVNEITQRLARPIGAIGLLPLRLRQWIKSHR